MSMLEELRSLLKGLTKPKFGSCIIHKTKGFYKIITDSKTTAGFFLGGEPVFLVSIDNVEDLQKCIFQSLVSSKSGVPVPKREDYKLGDRELCKKIGEVSYSSLYKSSNTLSLRLNEDELILTPLKYYNPKKPSQGLVDVDEDICLIKDPFNKKDEVTSLVIKLLEKDYKLI
jgi:hypothetical protein